MSENKPATTGKYKLIVEDMPAPPKANKAEERNDPPAQVQDDGWRNAARGSKPGDRYVVRPCGTKGSNASKSGDFAQPPVAPQSHSTWDRFLSWLRAHRS